MQTVDPYAFTDPAIRGERVPPDPDRVELDIWRRVLDPATGQPTGHLKRERMRTLGEVFHDLYARLNVNVCENGECRHEWPVQSGDYNKPCPKCGCREHGWFLDEYFSGPDHSEKPVPHNYRWIACYPVTGGSEGHYVHVEIMSPVEKIEVRPPASDGWGKVLLAEPTFTERGLVWRLTRLALGKTFRGMDHASEMALRCSKLLGA